MAWTPDYNPNQNVLTNREGQYFSYEQGKGWTNLGSSLPTQYQSFAPALVEEGTQTMLKPLTAPATPPSTPAPTASTQPVSSNPQTSYTVNAPSGQTMTATAPGGQTYTIQTPGVQTYSAGQQAPVTLNTQASGNQLLTPFVASGTQSTSSTNPFLEAPADTRPALPSLGGQDKPGPFGIPSYKSYYDQAYKDLDAYYRRILAEEYGDVDRAVARLREDYDRGMRISTEDYVVNLAYAQDSAAAARREEASTSAKENRALTGNLLSRGVYDGGVGDAARGETKSAQDLRREAIDRALKKSETDLGFTFQRGQEETTKTQKRGTEDTASNWQKFQTSKAMEREEKALGLAESRYGREFSAVSTQKSFDLAQQGLDLAKGKQ